MLDGLQQLIDLQALDSELAELRRELDAAPAKREQLAQARTDADAKLAAAVAAQDAAKAEQRRAEAELSDREALIHKLESQQSQVKTNVAYTALLHEIEQAREAVSGCETRILEAMEAIEAATGQRRAAEIFREQAEARIGGEEQALLRRCQELETRVAARGAERDGLCAAVPAEHLTHYDRITKRHGTAVARVVKELCQGCRMNLPPQLLIELLRGEKLITCTRCQRILVPEK